MPSATWGFILTRCVKRPSVNRYWNHCVQQIRRYYPQRHIVIIDDNSDKRMVHAEKDYENVTVVQSEFHGRGELLPFMYLLQHKWFDAAVILHDSVFIQARVPFEAFKCPVMPLWHHPFDAENPPLIHRLLAHLTNNPRLHYLCAQEKQTMGMGMGSGSGPSFNLCFGCQCFIKLSFLQHIQRKYHITNLRACVKTRPDRCALERVLGAIFYAEHPVASPSLFGNIRSHPHAFKYSMNHYAADKHRRRRLKQHFIKVWTGR